MDSTDAAGRGVGPASPVTAWRVVSCGPPPGWHEPSSWINSLLGPLMPLVLVGVYLGASSRDVRRRRPARRERHRRELRRHCALALLPAVVVTVPLTMLVRATLPA